MHIHNSYFYAVKKTPPLKQGTLKF